MAGLPYSGIHYCDKGNSGTGTEGIGYCTGSNETTESRGTKKIYTRYTGILSLHRALRRLSYKIKTKGLILAWTDMRGNSLGLDIVIALVMIGPRFR